MAELKTISLESIRIPEIRVSSILDEEQQALMQSTTKEIGLVQDIVVRDLGAEGYELVAGKSRLQEIKTLGFKEYQVKVIGADEKLALIMNIVENVARGSYDYISVAQSIRKLRSLGSTPEELERIFPWQRRWIQFIEDLQDLPEDVVQAVRAKKLTPTHVQLALNLTTPYEVHSGLRSAITHAWDTGTFKIYVQNRLEEILRAKKKAETLGVAPEIPPPAPELLVQYGQCLLCGYQKPREQITTQMVCEGCRDLAKYITGQLGPPEEAIQEVYAALKAYFGMRQAATSPGPGPIKEPSQG